MGFSRDVIRKQAKRMYKEKTRGVKKSQRVPFTEFFKQYKTVIAKNADKLEQNLGAAEDDFDFESLVNMNEIGEETDLEDVVEVVEVEPEVVAEDE